ncbi:MAG: PAS domain S-box protein [Desulfobacteraceae bacterium]|nr:PAS domain S-box protein [Desulfobacteraceae bacterium]
MADIMRDKNELKALQQQLSTEITKREQSEKEIARIRRLLNQKTKHASTQNTAGEYTVDDFDPVATRETLEGKARLFETIFNAIPDILGVLDLAHNIIRYNQAGYDFFSTDHGGIAGKKCYHMIGRTTPCGNCAVTESLETGMPARVEKYLENTGVWLDARAYPIFDHQGNVVKVVEHLRDISEMKTTVSALRESEDKYRGLVDNANDAIFILQDDRIKFPNPKARQMARELNFKTDQTHFSEYIHPDDREKVAKLHQQRISGKNVPPSYSFKLMKYDGSVIWVELNSARINWDGKPATLNFLRDITRQKKLEAQFHEAQRLDSLGTLGGGIAHDFNNLLMGIQGNLSLLFLDFTEEHEHYDKLKRIEQCVASGSHLTKQLLGFARGGKYMVRPTNLNEVVQKSTYMFGRTKKDIKIHGNYQKDIWTAEVDKGQIDQVLMNLLLNAAQAMETNGDIYLKTDNFIVDETLAREHDLKPGKYVKISVADTGPGIAPKNISRIFEPFFSTKEIGMGTGLGLASSFGIIKNHYGAIKVHSQNGNGAVFEIFIPASEKTPVEQEEVSDTMLTGTETILLVDDEEFILDVGRLMLEGLGYKILTADCGRAALNIFTNKKNKIDLIILDMIMPDMGGSEVFRRVKEMDDSISVLLSSGYNVDYQASALLEQGCNGFLQKPFNMKKLSHEVRRILDC